MSIGLRAALVVLAVCVAVILLREALSRLVPEREKDTAESRAPFLIGTLSGFNGLLLGFVLSGVWSNDRELQRAELGEVNAFVDLAALAQYFTPPLDSQLRLELQRYADAVVEREVPRLRRGLGPSAAPDSALAHLQRTLLLDEPTASIQQQVRNRALNGLSALAEQRRLRLASGDRPLPPLVWAILLAGAGFVVCGVLLVSLRYRHTGTVLLAAVAGMLALVLFAIRVLERPYTTNMPAHTVRYVDMWRAVQAGQPQPGV